MNDEVLTSATGWDAGTLISLPPNSKAGGLIQTYKPGRGQLEVYVDGESEEHEYLLSARKTIWAPSIDGEIYINDNELSEGEQIRFGQIYTVKVTELVGDKLLATVIK